MEKYTFKYLGFLGFIFLSCSFGSAIYAQEGAKINHIGVDEPSKSLVVSVTVPDQGKQKLDANDFTMKAEEKGRDIPLVIDLIQKVQTESPKQKDWTVQFLLDLSGSMRNRLGKAKEAILHTINSYELPEENTFISTFHDTIFPRRLINKHNVNRVLADITIAPKGQGRDTDLYRATLENIKTLERDSTTKKILILLTDGRNDIARNPYYKPPTNLKPVTRQDVFTEIAQLDTSFMLFPIGLSKAAEEAFLKQVAEKSPNTLDNYHFAQEVDQVEEIFQGVIGGLISNYQIYVKHANPNDAIFRGEERTLHFMLTYPFKQQLNKNFHVGSPTNIVDIRKKTPTDWIAIAILGLFILGVLLSIFMVLIPYIRTRLFWKKHVRRYADVKVARITKRDPVTDLPFKNEDLVVIKCKTMCGLETWKSIGNQCPYYPDCQLDDQDPCSEGTGIIESDRFFSQKGVYKKLNWLWFGALGGWCAWVIFAILKTFSSNSLIPYLEPIQNAYSSINVETLSRDIFVGFALGIGITLCLSIVEERGQSRKISYTRIIGRSLLGGILALLMFLGGYLIFSLFIKVPYIGGLLSWGIFGLSIGFVLSIKSSIHQFRSILGGLLASIVAYHVYIGLNALPIKEFELNKMVSFLFLGGIFGFIIVSTVTSYLDDFALEYVAPKAYQKTNPISKWLKTGMEIFIGTSGGCYVFIKWEDPAAKPQHAKLHYANDAVYLTPLAPILINRKNIPLKTPYKLKNGDLIQLGPTSYTQMRYVEKRRKGHKVESNISQSQPIKKIKPQIKIKKRGRRRTDSPFIT